MPQWSSIDRAGDHQVGRALGAGGAGLAHRLADDLAAAEHRLVAGAGRGRGQVLGDLDEQVGVGEPDPVAGGGAVERGVARAGQIVTATSSGVRAGSARRPGHDRGARRAGTSSTSRAMPGSKRTAVPAGTSRRRPRAACAVEVQAGLASAKW